MKGDAMRNLTLIVLHLVVALGVFGCGRTVQDTSALEGRVNLVGEENHEGVRVYVPGTARVAYTDSEGRFRLEPLPGGTMEVVLAKEGFTTFRKWITLPSGQTMSIMEGIPLNRQRGDESMRGGIQGTIVVEGRENAGGAVVMVQGGELSLSAITSTTGGFFFDALPPGSYVLHAFKTGYVTFSQGIDLPAEQILRLDPIRLNQGRSAAPAPQKVIQGMVQLEGAGDYGGVIVSVEGTSRMAVSDAEGRFSISDLADGIHAVSFQKVGYESRKVNVAVRNAASESLQVILRERTEALRTGSVEGFVQLQGGYATDLSGVEVRLMGGQSYQVVTSVNGRYVLSNVASGLYRLVAEGQGVESYELLGIQVQAGETTKVPPIELVAVDEPVAVETQTGTQLSGVALLSEKSRHEGITVKVEETNLITTTSEQGAYTFYGVSPGLYQITFHSTGYLSDEIKDVQVFSGQDLTLGPVTLYPEREKPYVLFTEPGEGSTGIPVKDFVDAVVVFSTRMNAGSVKQAVKIDPPVAHELYFGGEHPQADNDRLLIRFFKNREPTIQLGQEYQISIAASARDLFDVEMEEPYEFSFETSGPLIVGTYPADGAEDVFFTIDDYIMIDLNTEVDYKSVASSLNIRPKPDSVPIILPEKVPSGYRVKLELDFKDETRYDVTISSRLRTIDGRDYENTPYRFSFRTGSIRDEPDAIDDLIFSRENEY